MFDDKKNMNFDAFVETMNGRFHKFIEEEFVECTNCGCVLKKKYAPKVEHWFFQKVDLYFCKKCKPEYDIVYNGSKFESVCGFREPTYFKNNVRVDKNGKPINLTSRKV